MPYTEVKDNISSTAVAASVTITVAAPVALEAGNDTYWGTFNQPFVTTPSQSVLANDSSPNAQRQLSVVAVGTPNGGRIDSWDADGTFPFCAGHVLGG